ncbi:zinc-binding metallopeptidase family protein [Kaarinaea lacus]
MKTFTCSCNNITFFDNTFCQYCHTTLGFITDIGKLVPLLAVENDLWQYPENGKLYRKCQNYELQNACNWMVDAHEEEVFCLSCRLSEIIPDLSSVENVERWQRIEKAKRRLIYTLLAIGLPVVDRKHDPRNGIAFRLMQDQEYYSEFGGPSLAHQHLLTGHLEGVITLNIMEADPVQREEIRTLLRERYRTLLGHLRHESGHYYWEHLVLNSPRLDEFRRIFGDERADYDSALQNYYTTGPNPNWQDQWISAYATAHPWEDWAECWAHYLHMIDGLETANNSGFLLQTGTALPDDTHGYVISELVRTPVNELVEEWSQFSVALNEMNRSMGLDDAYPFVISAPIVEKLAFVQQVIIESV